jgi:hypothetical protein
MFEGRRHLGPATGDVYGILNSDVNAAAMEVNRRWLNYQPPAR